MKCEHCGKNEATFLYQSNINGAVTEKRLCSACAEDLGYTGLLESHSRRMMRGFDRMWNGSLLNDFFSPGLFGRMDRLPENPLDDFFAEMPALGGETGKETRQEPLQEPLVDSAEQARFARTCKINALREGMKKAAEQEEYERAAQLRDELRRLEAENGAGA